MQFEQAADTELSWLTEAERKLLSMGDIRLEQDQTTAQLQAQKVSRSHCVCVCADRPLLVQYSKHSDLFCKVTLLVLQIFSMDIMRHKDAVDEIVKTGKAVMNNKNPEEKEILKVK